MVLERGSKIFAVTLIFFLLHLGTGIIMANEVPRMSKEDLRAMLDNPDLILLDVRTGASWEKSKAKIQGAIREDPNNTKSWAEKYSPDKTLVLYCA